MAVLYFLGGRGGEVVSKARGGGSSGGSRI